MDWQDKYEPVIGLEVHAQLLTESKIFCSCRNLYGAPPNTLTCPVCLGMPGTLPVLNKKAVEFAIRMGLATECQIATFTRFARKNYFYPDLPKGYQISQYEEPLCQRGRLKIRIDGQERYIGITRIHLEEDAGKSLHGTNDTLVDFNRCGVPLIEIVSEPEIHSPAEAYAYLTKLKQVLEYLEISDCNMEEGSLRCDANISLRPKGQQAFGVKTEMKNMNSFRGVERALTYEIERQARLLDAGKPILRQTLLWDEDKGEARPMRTKEESDDYRYFPEPDLVPLHIDPNWIEELKTQLPESPDAKYDRFTKELGLRPYEAGLLTTDKHLAEFFEATNRYVNDAVLVSKWMVSEVLRVMAADKIGILQLNLKPVQFAELLNLIKNQAITPNVGKEVFDKMLAGGETAQAIVERENLMQLRDDESIEAIVKTVLEENPGEVARYKEGKKNLFGFFMGQVMKKTQGKANPEMTSKILRRLLD